MPLKSDFSGFLTGLFPDVSSSLVELYASAAENAGLLRTDFYTIRDLLDLSEYRTDEPLHVLLLCLMLALDEGSLCVEASEAGLARRLQHLGDGSGFARNAAQALAEGRYPALIGDSVDASLPVVLRRHGERAYLYFQKYLKHELRLHEQLCKRLGNETPRDGEGAQTRHATFAPNREEARTANGRLAAILDEVLNQEPGKLNGRPMRLNRDQRLAVALALLRNFTIVSGGPGTGKTSIVFTLLRCLVRAGISPDRIVLAAPTGRAAQRLTDAVRAGLAQLGDPATGADAALRDLAAGTLHHVLGFHPGLGNFRHHVENPLSADVVIVDEVSMVGLVLMAQLLQATEPATRLILLGDKDQLPSVDAGAVLANLAPADAMPSYSQSLRLQVSELDPTLDLPKETGRQPLQDALVILEENYRSQRDIQEIAAAVNRQDATVIERLRRVTESAKPQAALAGCCFLDLAGTTLGGWRRVLEQWLDRHYLQPKGADESYRSLVETCVLPGGEIPPTQQERLAKLFAVLARARVLTLVREGPWGCVGINQFLADQLRPRLDRRGRGRLFLGAPVLITRNDYARGLFNGDVGITLAGEGGGYRVVFARQDGYLAYPAETLPGHELAFALTVHKSQGSEYGQVLLVLPPEGGKRLLTKEMVYTGITRAKELAVICSPQEVLRFAIGRRVERESALLDF